MDTSPSFEFLPKQWVTNREVRLMRPDEKGRLADSLFDALERGDAEYLKQFDFIGRVRAQAWRQLAVRWVKYNPLEDRIESGPGCYVFYLDGQLTYIGQSADVKKRIASYRLRYGYNNCVLTPWGDAFTVHVKIRYSLRYGDWAMRELRLIKRLQPFGNCVGSVRRKGAAI